MIYTVLVFSDVHQSAIELLESRGIETRVISSIKKEDIIAAVGDVHALIVRAYGTIDEEVMEAATSLRCIVRAGIGVHNIDVEAAERHGIVVMNTPGCNSLSAAEFIFALFLTLSRNIITGHNRLHQGVWERNDLWGQELGGKVLGVIGFGRVARYLVPRAQAFDMEVVAHSPHLTKAEATKWGLRSVKLEELYRQSDYISIAFTVGTEHRGMVGRDEFALMRQGVIIVNISWVHVFDLKALAEAVRTGRVAGVGLDPAGIRPNDPDNPLNELRNIVYTPHLGAHTTEGQRRCSETAARQVASFLLEGRIVNEVT